LREREGLTSEEVSSVQDAFRAFAEKRSKMLGIGRVTDALRWLGYWISDSQARNQKISLRTELGGRKTLCEAEFLRIVRRQKEMDLKCTRQTFRQCAAEGGVQPLEVSNLRQALKMLNVGYLDHYAAWIRKHFPAKWVNKNATLDFEDFRRLVEGCRAKVRERLHRHHGFNDTEVAKLRIPFVKHALDQLDHNGGVVPSAKVSVLLCDLLPEMLYSNQVRNRVKNCMGGPTAKEDLTWFGFLRVMRRIEDSRAEENEKYEPVVTEKLGVPQEAIDEWFELYESFITPQFSGFSRNQLDIIVGKLGPLPDELLEEAEDLLRQTCKKGGNCQITVLDFVNLAMRCGGHLAPPPASADSDQQQTEQDRRESRRASGLTAGMVRSALASAVF